eukprot:1139872-Pelagomonas_calceolata.AAC.2
MRFHPDALFCDLQMGLRVVVPAHHHQLHRTLDPSPVKECTDQEDAATEHAGYHAPASHAA